MASPNAHPNRPRISIVIPVKDDAEELRHALAALAAQTLAPAEVVVLDNGRPAAGSVDEVERIAREAGARLVREPGGGIPAANAAAFDAATGDIVARMDTDCRPGPAWVAGIVRAFESEPLAHRRDGWRRIRRRPEVAPPSPRVRLPLRVPRHAVAGSRSHAAVGIEPRRPPRCLGADGASRPPRRPRGARRSRPLLPPRGASPHPLGARAPHGGVDATVRRSVGHASAVPPRHPYGSHPLAARYPPGPRPAYRARPSDGTNVPRRRPDVNGVDPCPCGRNSGVHERHDARPPLRPDRRGRRRADPRARARRGRDRHRFGG